MMTLKYPVIIMFMLKNRKGDFNMKRKIDCLIIGVNGIKFSVQEKFQSLMGRNNPAYQDINWHYIGHRGKVYSAQDILKMYYLNESLDNTSTYLTQDETLNPAIAYLGTYLHRRGLTFDYINAFQSEKEKLARMLQECDILTIGISTTNYVWPLPIIEIVSFIRKYNVSSKIIMGGQYIYTQVLTQSENSLQKAFKSMGADYYICSSQGEKALFDLISAIKNGTSPTDVNNLYYLDGDKFVATKMQPENNLLSENMVDWNLFSKRKEKSLAIRTSISCPYSCSFCEYPQRAGKYQNLCVEDVERELNAIASQGITSQITFVDDTFNVPTERFKEILRMMIRNKYNFKWSSYFRCQFADRETVELMKESGCQFSLIGIESANRNVLDNMNKQVSIEKYKYGISLLNEYDIMTYAYFLIGFPGETRDSVMETLAFFEETRPTFLRLYVWYCSTITPIYKQREKFNIQGQDYKWSHSTMDWETAYALADEVYCSLQNTIFSPIIHEDICILLEKGMSIQQIKKFLSVFNSAVSDKIQHKDKQEVSDIVMEELRQICSRPAF